MLKILFICSVYPPEPEPSAVMARQLARHLADAGHYVTMLVPFPNRPQGTVYPGYKRRLRQITEEDGIRIVRCPSWLIGGRRRTRDRILENFTFGLSCLLNGLCEKRPDVILLETWPIIASALGVLLGILSQTPVLNYVKDVYPESAEALNIIRPRSLFAGFLRAGDSWVCSRSACVIAISETMRQLLLSSRRIAPDRLVVVKDWIDADEFPQYPHANKWRLEMGISANTFIALFAGTMGLVSGVDVLIDVVSKLSNRPDILILCVGQGMLKEGMVAEALTRGIRNIRFEPFQPRERVPEMLAAANVMLLTLASGYTDTSVPSKLISYLAAGRPAICAAPAASAVARTVTTANAGVAVQPGCADSIAAAIRDLADHPEKAHAMGINARQCFEQHFTSSRAYAEFARIFERVTGEPAKRLETVYK